MAFQKIQLYIYTGLLIILMFAIIYFQQSHINNLRVQRDQVMALHLAQQDSTQRYRNKLGLAVARAHTLYLTAENLKRLQDSPELAWIKEEFKNVKKNLKNVEQATRITGEAIANFKIPLKDSVISLSQSNPDSVETVRTFNNRNEWFSVFGEVTKDTVSVTPHLPVTIDAVDIWERKKFMGLRIGRKEYLSEATSPNPYISIMNIKVIRSSKKKYKP